MIEEKKTSELIETWLVYLLSVAVAAGAPERGGANASRTSMAPPLASPISGSLPSGPGWGAKTRQVMPEGSAEPSAWSCASRTKRTCSAVGGAAPRRGLFP